MMNTKILTIASAIFILQGCALVALTVAPVVPTERTIITFLDSKDRLLHYTLDYMKGKRLEELIKTIGYPDSEREIAEEKIYIWEIKGRCKIQFGANKKGILTKHDSQYTYYGKEKKSDYRTACLLYTSRAKSYCERNEKCKKELFSRYQKESKEKTKSQK